MFLTAPAGFFEDKDAVLGILDSFAFRFEAKCPSVETLYVVAEAGHIENEAGEVAGGVAFHQYRLSLRG